MTTTVTREETASHFTPVVWDAKNQGVKYQPIYNTPGSDLVPEALHVLVGFKQWMCWKQVGAEKRPVNPHNGKYASWKNPDNHGSLADALRGMQRFECEGIGFVLTDDIPVMILDWDKKVHVDGKLTEYAHTIIDYFDSYTERSPSGRGIHVIVLADGISKNVRHDDGEIYSHGCVTFSGDPIHNVGVAERTSEVEKTTERNRPKPRTNNKGYSDKPQTTPDDDRIINRIRRAGGGVGESFKRMFDGGEWPKYKDDGDPDRSQGMFELMRMLAYWTGNDPDAMRRIFEQSPFARNERWTKREKYQRDLITDAINATPKPFRWGMG